MKQMLSILSIIAMCIAMCAVVTLPMVAENSTALQRITENVYTGATQGCWDVNGKIAANTGFFSGKLIQVAAGDVLYFGPVNLTQDCQLYDWHGTDFTDYTQITSDDVANSTDGIRTVATFPNGQGILAYEVTAAGRVGIVCDAAYNSFFLATKNVPMAEENYYGFWDLTKNQGLEYSATLGRYNTYETVESVLNGKSALFAGDSICNGAGDDDYFNNLDGRNHGGWSGRIKQFYQLSFAYNNGVGGTSLSTARDQWNIPDGKTNGRIYWQVAKEKSYHYDYVILHGGVNDAWETAPVGEMTALDNFDLSSFDTSTYAGGLEELFYYATTYHSESAIGYIMNFRAPTHTAGVVKDMSDYFRVGKQICEKWSIPYLDLYNTLDFDTSIYTYDKIHPNAAGYDILYVPIAEWMEELHPYSEHNVTEHEKTVIACVGDSLTKGELSGDVNRYSYPAYLQEMLGEDYDVLNLGWAGAAVQPNLDNTYKKTVQYKQSLQADPDQVIIMLGANDARTDNGGWDTDDHAGSCAKYTAALKALVEEYQNLPSEPTVYLATPPYSSKALASEIYTTGGLKSAVEKVAAELKVELIDTYAPTDGKNELLADGTHFIPAGYELLAGEMYKAITNKETAPAIIPVTEKDTAVAETDATKPLIRNWKAYYDTVDAFRIETVEDVEIFGDLIAAGYTFAGKTVYLEKDLDFTGMDFTPLGTSTGNSDTQDVDRSFQGTFDGQNHVFSNVHISSMYYTVGLFPALNGATIQNFGLDGGLVEGLDVIGSIAAFGYNGTSLYNVWSSADVYAAKRSSTYTSGIIGYIRKGTSAKANELKGVAYYGTLSSTNNIGGICGACDASAVLQDIVFGGTLEMRSKQKAVTPLVRYSTTDTVVTGATSGFYYVEGTEVRTSYLTDAVPEKIAATALTNGKFAYEMNASAEAATKWIVRDEITVPWGDDTTAIRKIKVDNKDFYTEPDGSLPESLLSIGSYWFNTDGKCYSVETARTWTFNDGDAIKIGISAAGADYTGDGSFGVDDATLLLQYIDGSKNGITAEAADVDADGKQNVFDAVRLLQAINDLVIE